MKRCYTKRAQLNEDDRGRRSTLVEMAATVVNENSMQREQRLKKKFIPFPPTEVLSLIAVKFKIFYLIRIISIVYMMIRTNYLINTHFMLYSLIEIVNHFDYSAVSGSASYHMTCHLTVTLSFCIKV